MGEIPIMFMTIKKIDVLEHRLRFLQNGFGISAYYIFKYKILNILIKSYQYK